MSTATSAFGRVRPSRETLLGLAVLVNTELLLVVGYVLWTGVTPSRPLFYIYPFVWINAGLWGLWRATVPAAPTRRRLVAGAVALGYLLLLGYFGGLYAVGATPGPSDLRVVTRTLPPGWSPALLYTGEWLTLALLPFKAFGYATLAYLVYATVLDAGGSATAGLLGLFSCVSCTLPLIAGVLSGFVGGTAALVSAAYGQSYGLSTVVFVLTVALLVWRPTAADLSRVRSSLRP
ncbi:hypothetical protein ACFQPA_08040 [Halomarina halobia]|uniref:ABC transporter ATP-binding protein n=1 Tax=Halomarina halobia TaxID=3033386 RepID=A0ABD6ABJ7_9EURY|nr:hypothetical protein [Halomarina sp. PSR21]